MDNHMLVVFFKTPRYEMEERTWFPKGDEATLVIFHEDIQYATPECAARAYENARSAIEHHKRLREAEAIASALVTATGRA